MPLISGEIFGSALPHHEFAERSKQWSLEVDSLDFAEQMDRVDPLGEFRKRFHYPKKRTVQQPQGDILADADDFNEEEQEECIYFCGHSLGLQLKSIKSEMDDVLHNWATRGVESHFNGKFPAASCDDLLKRKMANLVGAEASEVAVMNGLTVNIHVLLSSFYRPTSQRHKILMLQSGFPSDLYAVQSHVRFRGYDPSNTIVCLRPKPGGHLLNPKDILSFIEAEGATFALIFFEGVHFYTGQLFDIKNITRAGHKKGCVVGFDLAHAAGNVKLHLHDWNVDFAMWCTYKYLNSGAGNLGAIFVHSRHTDGNNAVQPMMAGWWGVDDKFSMAREFKAAEGADRFKISNCPPFLAAMIAANLDVFKEAGIDRLLDKQRLLTGYLEYLLRRNFLEGEGGEPKARPCIEIFTPANPRRRGSQISLQSLIPIAELENILKGKGIVCDVRKPAAMRVTPVPLYNTFVEVYKFVHILKDIFEKFSTTE